MVSCNSCNAPIVWARTVKGKAMPMERADDGTWIIVDGVMRSAGLSDAFARYKSHFATCPQAPQWRRKELK